MAVKRICNSPTYPTPINLDAQCKWNYKIIGHFTIDTYKPLIDVSHSTCKCGIYWQRKVQSVIQANRNCFVTSWKCIPWHLRDAQENLSFAWCGNGAKDGGAHQRRKAVEDAFCFLWVLADCWRWRRKWGNKIEIDR